MFLAEANLSHGSYGSLNNAVILYSILSTANTLKTY